MPHRAPSITQRQKDSQDLRARALVAAHYEDCFQASSQLYDTLEANRPDSDDLFKLAQECKNRLRWWAEDTGASSRLLDYALKDSPALALQTKGLLKDLSEVITQAIAAAPLQYPQGDDHDQAVQADQSMIVDQAKDNAAVDDPDVESSPEKCLEEALDIIASLSRLRPALIDPVEEEDADAIMAGPDQDMARMLNIAAEMFRDANESVVKRLAEANCYRRQQIRHSQQILSEFDERSEPGRRLPMSRIAASQLKSRRRAQSTKPGSSGVHRTIHPTDAETSTTRLSPIFDHDHLSGADQNSSVSATGSQPQSVDERFLPPGPGVELPTDDQFDCPYCRFELPLKVSAKGIDVDHWNAHYFLDLKPYMCTFPDCNDGPRTYGTKREWFQHELDYHRSTLMWSCGACRGNPVDLDSEPSFRRHFRLHHHVKASPQELSVIAANSVRYSTKPTSSVQNCLLCQFTCHGLSELENHVAGHLEAYVVEGTNDLGDNNSTGNFELVEEYLKDLPPPINNPEAVALASHLPAQNNGGHPAGVNDTPDNETIPANQARPLTLNDKVYDFMDKLVQADDMSKYRSNVPNRDPRFLGREQDLTLIHKYLNTPGRLCTVSGLPGIGKTAVALEYLCSNEQQVYEYVFWVEAEFPGALQQKYNLIGQCFGLSGPFPDENTHTYRVKELLAKCDKRWLLVFDNVSKWSDIARYIPRTLHKGKGSILITTRQGPLPQVPSTRKQFHVHLEPWDLAQSREYLLTSIDPRLEKANLSKHREFPLAQRVVEVVGRLPLAISMIVGYVTVSQCTLEDFLGLWEEKEARAKSDKTKAAAQSSSSPIIDSLWDIGIRDVDQNCRRFLDILSFLDPDSIEKDLLVGDHKEAYLDFLDIAQPTSYKRMIAKLSGRRLITVNETATGGGEAYTIHRLLQQRIQIDMDDFSYSDAFRRVFTLIRKGFPVAEPTQVPLPENLEVCKIFLPDISSFHRAYRENPEKVDKDDPRPEALAQLFYDAGFYVWAGQSISYDGIAFLETAERILDDMKMDQNMKLRADIHSLIGMLKLNMGCEERYQARMRLKRAREIREIVYQANPIFSNDVLLQNAENDYSIGLLNQHRFKQTGVIYEKCLACYNKWGPESENPFEYSKYWGNNSMYLMSQGKLAEAIDSMKHCMVLTKKFTGGKKHQYYRRVFMLACLLVQAGQLQDALELHLETLQARMELHGTHHENTLISIYAVGATYFHLGDFDSALEYMKQCVDFAKNSTWSQEALGRAQYHLSILYDKQGIEPETSQALREDAMKVLEASRKFWPKCLRGPVEDTMALFDDLQGTFQGRYTNTGLLKHILEHCKDGDEP